MIVSCMTDGKPGEDGDIKDGDVIQKTCIGANGGIAKTGPNDSLVLQELSSQMVAIAKHHHASAGRGPGCLTERGVGQYLGLL